MKKTLFFLGLILSVAFLYAQNSSRPSYKDVATEKGTSIVLWDNTNINITALITGGTCTYWTGDGNENENWIWAADDFEADGAWIIERIYSKGYYPDDEPVSTETMAIVIYLDDDGKPGDEIYRNINIKVANIFEPEIILPTPFTLPEPGKYWITVAAVYEYVCAVNGDVRDHRWCIERGTTKIGSNYHYYDKKGLFAGYVPSTWTDASTHPQIVPKLYSTYFRIEGDPNIPIDCQPVTNLKVVYPGTDCSKAELTWTAPSDGGSKYIIYRDGDEIATVETESYTDLTFEPTLAHAWEIVVDCDGYSPPTRVTEDPCKEPDCPQAPKAISLKITEYATTCEAFLQWQAPTEVLWDNVTPTNSGFPSMRYLMPEFGRIILADDFDVPAGETWYVSEVYLGGFYNDFIAPDFIGIEIYEDDGGLPGNQIHEDAYLTPIIGTLSSTPTVLLSEQVILSKPGKYWVAIYGTYDSDEDEDKLYYVYAHKSPKGERFARLDENAGSGWETFYPNDDSFVSLYFRIQGRKINDQIEYNICRDGLVIEENVTELKYTDKTFDPTKKHTWGVKTICAEGGVSAPVLATAANCKPVGINVNNAETFTIFPNPTTGAITIAAGSAINKIEVINFLGQTVFTQSNININEKTIDLSHLNNGVYFVRVASETGTSIQKFVKQ